MIRTGGTFGELAPLDRLAIAIVEVACRDAKRGSVEAVTWLLTGGVAFAEALARGTSDALLAMIADVAADLEAGELTAQYPALDGNFYEQLEFGEEVVHNERK